MSKKLRMIAISALCALTVVCSGTAIATMSNQTAMAATVWSEVTLSDTYMEGDTFNVPDRTVNVNGTEVLAKAVVTCPDGSTKTGESLVLDLAGEYTVTYTATVNKRVYTKEMTFVAQYRTARTYDSESTMEYGAHSLAPTVNGLKVRLAEGDSILFNEIIDMSNKTKEDTLFECFVTADNPGNYDFNRLFIQFTDVENSENYFKVRFIRSGDGVNYPYTYVLAGGNGQPMEGWEGGVWNKLHVNNDWGFGFLHSFYSIYNGSTSPVGNTRIRMSYDAAEKIVYANDNMVIDLDNPRYFTELWEGFQSNKVRLSVWADTYNSDSANFVITQAGDNFDLTKTTIEETTPPKITVNTDYAKDNMPDAKVGMTYPVATATAYDEYSGVCAVKTEVYYNYTNVVNATLVDIVDGKFLVENIGDYAIVYTAKDYMGNTTKEIYWLNALTATSLPSISLVSEFPKEMNAGELLEIPEIMVTGGSGKSVVKVYAGDEEVIGTYRPNSVGKHTIKIVATDYIGQETIMTVDIDVKGGTAPVFVDEPMIPKYLIAGSNYTLPKLYANDYTSGELVRMPATITVEDANGVKTLADGEKYSPKVANNFDNVKITYTAGATTYVVERPVVVAKDADGGIVKTNYFLLDGATITSNDDNSTIAATTANSGWTFANKLVAQEMTVTINAIIDKSTFDGLKFTLIDSLNPDVAIEAQLYKNGKNTKIITDVSSIDVEIGFAKDSVSNQIVLGYKDGKFTINGTNIAVKTTANGEAFNGFPSNYVYVSVEFINATGSASYSLLDVNGQKIDNTTRDRVAPKVVVLGERGGTKAYNTTTVLSAAMAGDVLDPEITFTMNVVAPNGDVVTSVDGVSLKNADPTREYEIKLEQYGQYRVSYTAKDTSNRTNNYQYVINVDDEQGPQMIFDHAFQTEAKVGDVIVIPNFTCKDNHCETEEIVITKYCLTPTGILMVLPSDSNAVKTSYAGTYVFRIVAMDAAGNKTMCRMSVTVTE